MSINIDVVILCGGKGTRIKDHLPPGVPKCMANINGRRFIERQIEFLKDKGFRRFVLCAGYGQEYLREISWGLSLARTSICIVEEDQQLGTAAALVLAIPEIGTDPFLIVNGDTICEMDYGDMIRTYYRGQGAELVGSCVTIAAIFNRLPLPSWTPAGVWLCSKKLFPYLFMGIPRLDVALTRMTKDYPIRWFAADRFWDIGSLEGLDALRKHWEH